MSELLQTTTEKLCNVTRLDLAGSDTADTGSFVDADIWCEVLEEAYGCS